MNGNYIYSYGITESETEYIEGARHTNVNCPLHLHYAMELIIVKSGELIMNIGGNRVLHQGEATLVLPFEPHSFETKTLSECLVIVFSPCLVSCFFDVVKSSEAVNKVVPLSKSTLDFADSRLPDSNGNTDCLHAKAFLYPICSELYDKSDFVPCVKRFERVFIDALRYIGENFKGEVTLETAAHAIGVHPVHLSRTFRKNSGVSFTRYLSNMRSSFAARLIESSHGEKSISDAAYEAGFGSLRSFNRAFRDFIGMTPTAFLHSKK